MHTSKSSENSRMRRISSVFRVLIIFLTTSSINAAQNNLFDYTNYNDADVERLLENDAKCKSSVSILSSTEHVVVLLISVSHLTMIDFIS